MVSIAVPQILSDPTAQQAANSGMPQRITQAIQTASARTGVNFAYLLTKAQQESNFNPNAKAANSSATGLFQFTGQTWLQEMKAHGTDYGLGDYADHIRISSDGVAHVDDPVWRRAILGLRKDPQISAEMAGELDKENSAALQATVGGKIGPTELYLAHFLGAGGAGQFLNALHANPNTAAADIVPEAAAANSTVFYNADGTPRTVGQIYKHFAMKFDTPIRNSATMLASAAPGQISAQPAVTAIPVSEPAAIMPNATANYAARIASITKAPNSSLFATMMLAQMKTDEFGLSASAGAMATHNRKNAISTLGALA